jgi:hypothetical protein
MMFDMKTMLMLGVSLGVIAFLIWTMFFKTKPTLPEAPDSPPQEEQGDPKVMTM